MKEGNVLGPVAGLTMIAGVGALMFYIRRQMYNSSNETVRSLVKISDFIVWIRFAGVLIVILLFMAIAMATGGNK